MIAAMPDRSYEQATIPTEFGLLERDAEAAVIEGKARLLALAIADAADADQWAVTLVGHPGLGDPDFDELVPRWYLEGLSGSNDVRYRVTLVLQAEGKDLGMVRLGTVRPGGFTDDDVQRAGAAVACAAEILERLVSVRWPNWLATPEPFSAA
jgi:hypothetical protein